MRAGLTEVGDIARFGAEVARGVPGSFRYFSEILRHAATLVSGTTVLLFVMTTFIGVNLANFGFFFLRSIGGSDFVGVVTGLTATRVLAVVMFGYVFTAKVCCGMTADLGAMTINEEIDAHESVGVDPLRYVVATRIVACLLYVPIASAVSVVGVAFGGWLDSVVILKGLSSEGFFQFHWSTQALHDQFYCLVTQASIAVATATIACFYGLRTGGGPAGVGSSVATALAVNLVVLQIIGAFYLYLFYGSSLGLPFGG